VREPYTGTRQQRGAIRELTSSLIRRYIFAIHVRVPTDDNPTRVTIEPAPESQVALLKQLTWHYVIHAPGLATQQYGYRRIVRELFSIFLQSASSINDRAILPLRCREALSDPRDPDEFELEEERVSRVILDHIASMTEDEAMTIYRRLSGLFPGSVTDVVVR
jgi:dGTPase